MKQKKLGSWRLEDGSQIEWDKETTTIKILLINNKSEKLNDMLTSPHIFNLFFHTGWFEYEVAESAFYMAICKGNTHECQVPL